MFDLTRPDPKLSEYDHLNGICPVVLYLNGAVIEVWDLPALVRAVRRSNHGIQRFMAEYLRQKEAEAEQESQGSGETNRIG